MLKKTLFTVLTILLILSATTPAAAAPSQGRLNDSGGQIELWAFGVAYLNGNLVTFIGSGFFAWVNGQRVDVHPSLGVVEIDGIHLQGGYEDEWWPKVTIW